MAWDVPLRGLSGWSANTNFIEYPADPLNNNLLVYTIGMWARYASSAVGQTFVTKRVATPAGIVIQLLSTARLQMFRHRATTNLAYQAELSQWTIAATNTWLFAVFQMDINNAGGNKIWLGSEVVWAYEPSSYITATLGAGNVVDDSGSNVRIGDTSPGGGTVWGDRLASFDFFNRTLTRPQIHELQATGRVLGIRPIVSSRFWGTTQKQIDRSGVQLHGTVTGTLTENLGPIPRIPWAVLRPKESILKAPAGGVTVPVLYRQRQMQGMAS